MAAVAAVLADAETAYGQIHIVVDDVDVGLLQLIPAHEGPYGLAAVVHVSLRLDEDDLFPVYVGLGNLGVHPVLPQRHVPALRQLVDDAEARIVF